MHRSQRPTVTPASGAGIAVLLASLLVAPTGLAQVPQPATPREGTTLRETIDVRLLHLDAVVTDRTGQPLLDLETRDFDLRIDRQKVEVTSVSQGTDLRDSIGGRLTLVVLVDERHVLRTHRDSALLQIEAALLEEMRDHPTWIAVTSLSDPLEPMLAPTRDVAAVKEAFAAARNLDVASSDLVASQRSTSFEVRDVLRQLTKSGSTYRFGQAALQGLLSRSRNYGKHLAAETLLTLEGIEQLVEALSFVPGRKGVLLLTDGLPREPLDRLADTMSDRLAGGSVIFEGDEVVGDRNIALDGINSTNSRPTGSDRGDAAGQTVEQLDDGGASDFQQLVADLSCGTEFDHLSALANTHRVTFYAIKPAVSDATRSGLGERAGERGSIVELSDMTSGLESLAIETGGLSFTGDKDLAGFLKTARSDVSSYYSLGFTPPDGLKTGAIREIEVKVRRKKARVRHRASYVPLTMEERLASLTWGTLVFDWQENTHGIEIDTSEEPNLGELRRLQVLVSLPLDGLELVESAQSVAGNFRVVVQLRDRSGRRLEPHHLGFVVQVPQTALPEARSQFFGMRAAFELPLGHYRVAVGLWEENTGRTSFVSTSVQVGAPEPPIAGL